MRYRVDPERPAPRKVEPTIESVRRGNVIIYPTDTGYAFGCALSSAKGIHTLRRLKGIHEKHWKPLAMLVQSFNDIGRYGYMDNKTFRLMRRLLPGPYTLVLRSTNDVPRSMQNRHNEVGLRLPDHPLCAMLVDLLGEPLLTGSVSPSEEPPELEDALQHGRHRSAARGSGPPPRMSARQSQGGEARSSAARQAASTRTAAPSPTFESTPASPSTSPTTLTGL